jgi:hypothetical protein
MSNRKASSRRKKRQPTERTPISKAKNPTKKKRPIGRPALGAEYINTRVPKEMLIAIDDWRASQPDKPIRIEAVRRLVALALHPPKRKPAPARVHTTDIGLHPDLLAQIDAWRMSRPKPQPERQAAIDHLITTALKLYATSTPGNLPAPERIHAEGEPRDWADAAGIPADAPQRPVDTSDASGPAKDAPKAQDEPPRPPKND